MPENPAPIITASNVSFFVIIIMPLSKFISVVIAVKQYRYGTERILSLLMNII
ncbi:MAG: hypothetical protein ACJA0E_001923 [Bermanella sp.]|jgi:hypothetical protein